MSHKRFHMQIAFSWLLAFLQILETCVSRFSLLSISIPNNLTDDSIVNSTPFIFNTDLLRSFLELIIIDWNLFRFTILLFVLNQFITVSHSFRDISKSSVKSLLPTYIVLSSSKFARSASLIKKNKLFIKRLKRISPRIDPWGTPEKRICKKLSVSLILTLCFLRFNYE